MTEYNVTMLLEVRVSGTLSAKNPADAQNQLRDMVIGANKEFAEGNPKLQVERIIGVDTVEVKE